LGDRAYVTLAQREAIARRPWLGPDIIASGPPITTPGGHCWFLGGESTAGTLIAVVEARAARGVDVIKIMATGGKITAGTAPHESQFDAAALAAVVRAAHNHGLPVTAHAHGPDGIRGA